MYHEAVADSWSAALLWQELLADYDRAVHRRPLVRAVRPGPDAAGRAAVADRPKPGCGRRPRGPRGCAAFPPPWTWRRVRRGPPCSMSAASGCTSASTCGCGTRPTRRPGGRVCRTARCCWRRGRWPWYGRAGLERLLVGCEVPRRATAALLGTLAPYSATVPVGCELEGGVDYFLRGVACAFSEALGCADLDTAELARELGVRPDRSRPVLTPVTFAARDELLPASVRAGALSARFHHGHAGAVTADAALTVLRWRENPLLRLEFAPAVLSRTRAVRLARELRTALTALTTAPPHTPVDDLLPAPAGARNLALPLS
ncbi:hypothetical protein HEP87_53220 [Streptomyces sp. S1D4-11]|nr:hypothetical protein [Streptomyces sp. S1D4-11]QIZ00867.1 hypothetical protein HEP87_53220 [Streptomyces sp. S1D4-11]